METFRLWLENDKEIPRFKRLVFEKVNVSIKDVILKDIHPWMGGNIHKTLGEKFVKIMNSDDLKTEELAQANYCQDVAHSCFYSYYNDTTPFEEILKHIKEGIYFVDRLTYLELISIAKERLKKMWSHNVVYKLLERAYPGFDAMRSFLRSKDKRIKLSGYTDINKYDLKHILNLSDFDGEDNLIISEGIPVTNFRSVNFLNRVTDDRGFLKLTNHIEHFQVQVNYQREDSCSDITIHYNCQSNSEKIRFRPEIDKDISRRDKAKEFASRWRTEQGRYCFTTDISRLGQIIEQSNCKILFPSLDYIHPREGYISYSNVTHSKVMLYSVGGHITHNASCETIRELLRVHCVSMTGRKEDLAEKLAKLAIEEYKEKEPEINSYFNENKFIRVSNDYERNNNTFPILKEYDLRNLILAMYIIKHMRGNAILEAAHNNDTYDLLSLAQALIKKDISLEGMFLYVE